MRLAEHGPDTVRRPLEARPEGPDLEGQAGCRNDADRRVDVDPSSGVRPRWGRHDLKLRNHLSASLRSHYRDQVPGVAPCRAGLSAASRHPQRWYGKYAGIKTRSRNPTGSAPGACREKNAWKPRLC